jgi:hypothetical protein
MRQKSQLLSRSGTGSDPTHVAELSTLNNSLVEIKQDLQYMTAEQERLQNRSVLEMKQMTASDCSSDRSNPAASAPRQTVGQYAPTIAVRRYGQTKMATASVCWIDLWIVKDFHECCHKKH